MASNSMPTSETRAQASTTIPLSRIRSITSARLLDAFNFSIAIDMLLSERSDGVSSSVTCNAQTPRWVPSVPRRRFLPGRVTFAATGKKSDGGKGNPADVEGVGSESVHLSRRPCASAARRKHQPQAPHKRAGPRVLARVPARQPDIINFATPLRAWFQAPAASSARGRSYRTELGARAVTSKRPDEVLYFTLMYRPAGQLSLLQASGLWLCSGHA